MAFSPGNRFSRPTCAQIDLAALRHNLGRIRSFAGNCRITAVVKANAYGHGAVPIAHELSRQGIDCFGVSLVEEGVELRQAGLRGDIIVLGGAWSDDDEIVLNDLTPLVFTPEQIFRLDSAAKRIGRPVHAHLKLDTGMGRIGIGISNGTSELENFLSALKSCPMVHISGVASHFANSEIPDHPHNNAQLERFQLALQQLKSHGMDPKWRHMANSGALLQIHAAKDGVLFNQVRPGIMLYGQAPSEELIPVADLRAVLSWRTSITHLKRVPEGCPISYNGRWTTSRDSLIATIPVGYADGYNRRFGNTAEVLIRGMRAPVVGTVCMDMCMVDVTHIPDVALMDEVVLLGRQGKGEITAQELATRIGTIPYEILTSVGARVPRVVIDSQESMSPVHR